MPEQKVDEKWVYPPQRQTHVTGGPGERVHEAIAAYNKLGPGEHQMEVQGGMAEVHQVSAKTNERTKLKTTYVCVWKLQGKEYVLMEKEAIVVACAIEAEAIMNNIPESEYTITVASLRRAVVMAQQAFERDGAAIQ